MSEYEFPAEIEAKLKIFEERARRYRDFVQPADEPPLLWQMAMLAQAGFTTLPRVEDPEPDKSFGEMEVVMREAELGEDHFCLVGGYKFDVMRLDKSSQWYMLRPKPPKMPYYFSIPEDPGELPGLSKTEHFSRRLYAVEIISPERGRMLMWESRIMICEGSLADKLERERRRV